MATGRARRGEDCLTDVPGITVGQAQDDRALTGCTVVLAEAGAVGGVDVRGSAPGTRETDLLRPGTLVEHAHAVLLSGGSAYGLDAAAGVVRYLAERKIGFPVAAGVVPIVPAAVLFDLGVGDGTVRPDAEMAYRACLAARTDGVDQGNVGAGTGASVGKALGIERAMKGGIGTASERLGGGLIVGAIVAMNAWGHVIDEAGTVVAGPRDPATDRPVDTLSLIRRGLPKRPFPPAEPPGNTVIGLIATNARLTKDQVNKVAQMGHTGLARVVVPCHSLFDGDALFALATGAKRADVTVIGAFAAEAVRRAALRAVLSARPAGGLPAAVDFR